MGPVENQARLDMAIKMLQEALTYLYTDHSERQNELADELRELTDRFEEMYHLLYG